MSKLADLLYEQIESKRKAEEKYASEKKEYMRDPAKLDALAGKIYEQVSSSTRVAPKSKSSSYIERVDMGISEDSVMKGFGQEFKKRLQTAIADPKNAGYGVEDIAYALKSKMLGEPISTEEGKVDLTPRIEKAYEQHMLETTKLFGGNKSAKAPSDSGYMDYDTWKNAVMEYDKNDPTSGRSKGTLEDWAESVKFATAAGAVGGAAFGLATGGIAAPIEALLGAGIWGGVEAVAYPFRNWLEGTEWKVARDRFGSGAGNWLAMKAAKYGPELAVVGIGESIARKAITNVGKAAAIDAVKTGEGSLKELLIKPKVAKKAAVLDRLDRYTTSYKDMIADTTAENVAKVADVEKEINSSLTRHEVLDELSKQGKHSLTLAGDTKERSLLLKNRIQQAYDSQLGKEAVKANSQRAKNTRRIALQLDDEGFNKALADPDGIDEGVLKQWNEMQSKKLMEGTKTVDEVVAEKVADTKTYDMTLADEQVKMANETLRRGFERDFPTYGENVNPRVAPTRSPEPVVTFPMNQVDDQAEAMAQGLYDSREAYLAELHSPEVSNTLKVSSIFSNEENLARTAMQDSITADPRRIAAQEVQELAAKASAADTRVAATNWVSEIDNKIRSIQGSNFSPSLKLKLSSDLEKVSNELINKIEKFPKAAITIKKSVDDIASRIEAIDKEIKLIREGTGTAESKAARIADRTKLQDELFDELKNTSQYRVYEVDTTKAAQELIESPTKLSNKEVTTAAKTEGVKKAATKKVSKATEKRIAAEKAKVAGVKPSAAEEKKMVEKYADEVMAKKKAAATPPKTEAPKKRTIVKTPTRKVVEAEPEPIDTSAIEKLKTTITKQTKTLIRSFDKNANKTALKSEAFINKKLTDIEKALEKGKLPKGLEQQYKALQGLMDAQERLEGGVVKEAVKETPAAVKVTAKEKEVAASIGKTYSSASDARNEVMKIRSAFNDGKLTAEEACKQVYDVNEAIQNSSAKVFKDTGIVSATERFLAYMSNLANKSKAMLLLGLPVGMYAAFADPDEAEASVASAFAEAAVKAVGRAAETAEEVASNRTALLKGFKELGLVTEDISRNPDVLHLAPSNFQNQLSSIIKKPGELFKKSINDILAIKDTNQKYRFNLMNMPAIFEEMLKTKEGLMINPGTHYASVQGTIANNIQRGVRVAKRVLGMADVDTKAFSRISKEMEPLVEDMNKANMFTYYKKAAESAKKEIASIAKRLNKKKTQVDMEAIAAARERLTLMQSEQAKYSGSVEKFHNNWMAKMQEMAPREKNVRMFLALDDSADFKKYPWMQNVGFSYEEKEAVARIKNQLASYRARMEAAGMDVRKGDYAHYALHKNAKASMQAMLPDVDVVPFLKEYSRAEYSRALMPDINFSMMSYISDVEHRLQSKIFWDKWGGVKEMAQNIPMLKQAFDVFDKSLKPVEFKGIDNAFKYYSTFEAIKRLFLLPSAGFKHLVKMSNDMATLGVIPTLRALPKAAVMGAYRAAERVPVLRETLSHLKLNNNELFKLSKDLHDAMLPVRDTHYRMTQMGFGTYDAIFDKANVMLNKVSNVGSFMINMAETIDRSVSVEAGLRMAAKKGMTAEQAVYGIYDVILKNNFLGGELTRPWLKNPRIKAFMMFQTTPYKIFERRAVVALKAGRAIKNMGKDVFEATRTAEGRQRLYKDIVDLGKYVTLGKKELKSNIIMDALRTETDFFGTNSVQQFARDLVILGAATYGGHQIGVDLYHQFFHMPFVKSYYSTSEINIATSPIVQAWREGWQEYKDRDEFDDEGLFKKVWDKWSDGTGIAPSIFKKYNRISSDDIPSTYQGSKWKYILAVPAYEEDEWK